MHLSLLTHWTAVLFCIPAVTWIAHAADQGTCEAGDGGPSCAAETTRMNRTDSNAPRVEERVRSVPFAMKHGATAGYFYPQGRGHPHHFGQSPYTFGGRECQNLSLKHSWTWQNREAGAAKVTTGKAVVDDQLGIYYVLEDSVRKFAPNGTILWVWQVPQATFYLYPFKHIPNHPALYDGLLYNCISDGRVVALDMETGFQIWESKVSNTIGGDTAFVTAYSGRLFLDVDEPSPQQNIRNRIISLNATTGEKLWEYHPDTGVWNFLPHFPGDDTLVFMGWGGDAHRLNITTGEQLWRAGHPPNYTGWTDGGPALGPNGVFYTVSSTAGPDSPGKSKGGGIHAFAVDDGRLLWEHDNLEMGIYTYPGVGRLNPREDTLSVVTGVGSLATFPAAGLLLGVLHFTPRAGILGFALWLAQLLLRSMWAVCRRRERPRVSIRGAFAWASGTILVVLLLVVVLALVFMLNFGYDYSIRAYNAETGVQLWRVDLPRYLGFSARGDEAGLLSRWWGGTRLACLPCASGYGVIDAQGMFWMPHLDGLLWRVKDWNGNGRIDEEDSDELCSVDLGSASTTGGVTIVPGMLIVSTCDSLVVFKE